MIQKNKLIRSVTFMKFESGDESDLDTIRRLNNKTEVKSKDIDVR